MLLLLLLLPVGVAAAACSRGRRLEREGKGVAARRHATDVPHVEQVYALWQQGSSTEQQEGGMNKRNAARHAVNATTQLSTALTAALDACYGQAAGSSVARRTSGADSATSRAVVLEPYVQDK